jgi:hypothetical protein
LQNNTPPLNTTSFTTGYINLYSTREIYIASYGPGNFTTISMSGERATVKQVPVTANHGEFIFDMNHLKCSKQTISRIRLSNMYGEPFDLHRHHWSFSIVFSSI